MNTNSHLSRRLRRSGAAVAATLGLVACGGTDGEAIVVEVVVTAEPGTDDDTSIPAVPAGGTEGAAEAVSGKEPAQTKQPTDGTPVSTTAKPPTTIVDEPETIDDEVDTVTAPIETTPPADTDTAADADTSVDSDTVATAESGDVAVVSGLFEQPTNDVILATATTRHSTAGTARSQSHTPSPQPQRAVVNRPRPTRTTVPAHSPQQPQPTVTPRTCCGTP